MHTNLRLYPEGRYRKSATVVGECFVKNTLVATEQGLVSIQDIQRGDRVVTESGLKPVTELYEMPSRPLKRIRLRNGIVNTVTPSQPVRVLDEHLELQWRNAGDLAPGDWVVLKKADCFPENPVTLAPFRDQPMVFDERLAYALGLFMSDGWISADYGPRKQIRIAFCGADRKVVETVRQAIHQAFGYLPSLEMGAHDVYTVRINNSAVNAYLAEQFGLTADLDATSKFVPAAVLRSPRSVILSFLAGLFDGDGSLDKRQARVRYVSVSENLVRTVQILLQHLGILAVLRPYTGSARSGYRLLHALEIHGRHAQLLMTMLPVRRASLVDRIPQVMNRMVYSSSLETVPYAGAHVFEELSAHHRGGGWYEDRDGQRFRQGIRYPDGTKIRYASDLKEQPLAFTQMEAWGIFDKLERIGSPLYDTLRYFVENDLFFMQVECIEEAPAEPTYDLHVADDHNFVANGVIVHNCMGKYHPHGDTAIYDAMVRMAQPFSLRAPLVDGHGNFGSLDGDSPAAMRYTEVKLRPLAMQMLDELRKQTVDFRPTFDGQLFEPVVLPSRVPNLLVNGASGIAVGMATNIPPHHLGEVVDALIYMIGTPAPRVETLVAKFIPGPDFPTGGRILNTEEELVEIYRTGEGTIHLRGEYELEGKSRIVITSIPYGVTKSDLVEKIAEHIAREHVPQLSDIRDESTDDVRIVLELKRGASAEAAMAYLFKHTPLQTRFHVNLTCLVPTENPEVAAPQKVDLVTALRHFLVFRMEVVTRRLRYDLEQLEKRIHILRGFEKIFDALDEAIRIIRASKNKQDAAQRLMHRFRLDDVQAEAILETKLYRLSQLEIEAIRRELEEKERQAAELRALLADEDARWRLIRDELRALKKDFADERRTTIAGPDEDVSYSEEDYIIKEDVYVIVTRDGWVKRQRSYTEIGAIRVRDGDEVGWVLPGSTRATIGFFTNFGKCYTVRIDELPSTTGYGDPVQKLFDFSDRERVVGVVSFDERVLPRPLPDPETEPELFEADGTPSAAAHPYLVAVTKNGQAVRLTTEGFADPSTRAGRMFMRLGKGDEVLGAEVAAGDENVCLAAREGHVLIFPVRQIPVFKGAAKGVIAMRLGKNNRLLGFTLSNAARDGLEVETNRGRREVVRTTKFEVSNRGNRGRQIIKRGHIARVILAPTEMHLNGKR
ncbi:MAG: DNA topoisomerase 4 subunit A [Bacteroidetes bacterium]|nr:MAG: DNA topoisomerase 4 subunit A [Bacteroidota bacterium]